jgi:hypothetical protein
MKTYLNTRIARIAQQYQLSPTHIADTGSFAGSQSFIAKRSQELGCQSVEAYRIVGELNLHLASFKRGAAFNVE